MSKLEHFLINILKRITKMSKQKVAKLSAKPYDSVPTVKGLPVATKISAGQGCPPWC